MCSITQKQCDTIIESYLKHNNYKIIDYTFETADDALIGYMSYVSFLKVKLFDANKDQEEIVRFFMKFLPKSDYHLSVLKKACCFKKEAAFFGTPFKGIRSLLIHKSLPECYLKDCESVIALEDLTSIGYRNCQNSFKFNLEHTRAAIRALADIHSASIVFEHKIGKQLDHMFSDEILRPWFSPIKDYPGFNENLCGAKVITKILEKYFISKYPNRIIDQAKKLCFGFSDYCGRKSVNYQNAISHQDLWSNNIMFKYSDNGTVDNAVIIDFQIFGYCPPSLDLLMMLYCNVDKSTRAKHMQELLDFYYDCLSENIEHHNLKPVDILSRDQFTASMEETRPIAIASTPMYLQVGLAPDHEMLPILQDVEKLKIFLEKDRYIVLDMLDKYDYYRDRVLTSVEELLDYLND